MKRILCYGDSNTWGYDPVARDRFDAATRWTRVLAASLGADYEIIEEGLCGRTTIWDDPVTEYRNGRTYLIPCLDTHCPLDLVVLMLGTNDLKSRFSLSAYDIAAGAGVLVDLVQRSEAGRNGRPPLSAACRSDVGTSLADGRNARGSRPTRWPRIGRNCPRTSGSCRRRPSPTNACKSDRGRIGRG